MLRGLCICAEIPQIRTRSRWVFVEHRSEQWKTTNTGHIAAGALAGSSRSLWWSREHPPDPAPDWGPAEDRFVLFPRTGVEPVPAERVADWPRPPTLVVLDGTWSQTRKMARGIAALQDAPCVALPAAAHNRYSLRKETLPGGLTTLDAVAWLLAALEGEEPAARLLRVLRLMAERVHASRGTPLPGGPRITSAGLVPFDPGADDDDGPDSR
jgi:DTW domain-containing protein YfiP